ncbi:MAG: thiol-activated cytolysin family protein [Fibrobacter sp.]|nr:thiol-activated cytolysin family protein [Fibrobacter sp.]
MAIEKLNAQKISRVFGSRVLGSRVPGGRVVGGSSSNANSNTPASTTSAPVENVTYASDAARRDALRTYFNQSSSEDQIHSDPIKNEALNEYLVLSNCVMKQYNEVRDINNVVSSFAPISETNIYPGCLVYADKELLDGSPTEVNFYVPDQLGKVTVNVQFMATNEKMSETGVKADYSSIKDAISRILSRALPKGKPAAAVDVRTNTYNSVEKMAIDMGCSVEYLGAKCKIDTQTSKSSERFFQMQHFNQAFYTVSVEAENKDTTNFVGADVTPEVIKNVRRTRNNAPIAIIKSVTYGRFGFYQKEFNASSFAFKGSQDISYKTVASVSSKQDISKNSSSVKEYARIFGGSATQAGSAILAGISKTDGKDLGYEFTKAMSQNMEVSMENQGVPIFYEVQYLSSGKKLECKMTGKYNETSYATCVNQLSVEINNDATTLRGTNSVKPVFEWEYDQIDSQGRVIARGTGGDFWNFDRSKTRNVVMGLPENCYFRNNTCRLKLQSRRGATAGLNTWKTSSEGDINVSGGKLKMKISGNYYKYNLYLSGDADQGYTRFK